MWRLVRISVLWLIVLVIPVQGIAAASAMFCDLAPHAEMEEAGALPEEHLGDPSMQLAAASPVSADPVHGSRRAGDLEGGVKVRWMSLDMLPLKTMERLAVVDPGGESRVDNRKCDESASFFSVLLPSPLELLSLGTASLFTSALPSAHPSFLTGAPERPPRNSLS